MSVWTAVLLGILQGVTEFLPISSSGHLVIVPYLLGWQNPGLALDTMLHMGTLVAIFVYFWEDLWRLIRAALQSMQRRSLVDPDARLAWMLVIATVPGAVLGFFLEDVFEQLFQLPHTAARFLLVTALLLVLSERIGSRLRSMTSLSWVEALLIGLAQSAAIAPGLSRSGATIAAGQLLGLRREDAARFSFLLAIPITLGAGVLQTVKLVMGWGEIVNVDVALILAGMAAAAVSGYLTISALLAFIKRRSLIPFAVYCVILSVLVLTGVLG